MKKLFKVFGLLSIIAAIAVTLLVYSLYPPDLIVPATDNQIVSRINIISPDGEIVPDQTIVIEQGRIINVRSTQSDDPEPVCNACYAIPGLIDAHVHTPPAILPGQQKMFALLYLEHGVTSVRDVGASDDSVAIFAKALNSGRIPGPNMYRCGPVLEGSPPAWPVARVVSTSDQGRDTVKELISDGVDCIKIYNEIDLPAYKAIAETAAKYNVPVIGHVPHKVGLNNTINFESQHFTGLPYVARPRPPIGTDIDNVDILNLSKTELDEALKIAKKNGIAFTPTLANFYLRLSATDPERFPPPAALSRLPAYWRTAFPMVAGHPRSKEEVQNQIDILPILHGFTRSADDIGLDILAGTDTLMPFVIPGDGLHRELEQLALSLSPRKALRASLITNARHIDNENLGSIEIGKRADILLLTDNPLDDLNHLRDWSTLYVAGRRYDREEVQKWVNIYLNHFSSPVNAWIMSNVVELISRQYQSSSAQIN